MVHSRLTAHGSRLTAHGSRAALCALVALTFVILDRPLVAQGPDLFTTPMSRPSELPESVRDPLAALLAGFKKEAQPYVWSYGVGGAAKGKEVLWYVLPASGYAPYVAPGNPSSTTPNSPYTTPAGNASNFAADNPPANVGTFPFHPNITRHWSAGSASYVVTIPNTVPAHADGTPELTGAVQKVYTSLPAASTYTWQNWVDDVQAVMNKFVTIPTAQTSVAFNGVIYEPTPYDTTLGGVHAFGGAGTFIWSVFDTVAGPTGNGINEIILTDQSLPGLGLTSMLVDPANGQIIECDVLFDATALIVPNPWQVGGNPVTPHNWTALPHELGHFWGLDHTNLHTGAGTSGVATVTSGSAANYPGAQVTALPGMVGTITFLGPSADVTSSPLHVDDTTGISLIYPVLMPRKGSGRYPLINQTASIRGRFQDANGSGVFGKNLWVVPALTAAAPGVYPERGVISGTARNDMDHFFLASGLYVDNRPGMGSAPYYTGSSVVGLSGAGNVSGTGDFAIEGLPVGDSDFTATSGDPLEYDLVMEDSGLLGVQTINQAEWFNEGTFYTGNTPTITGGVPPLVMVHSSTTSSSVGGNLTINSTPSTSFTSTSVVPGTVIHVLPAETSEYAAGMAPNWLAPNVLSYPQGSPPPFYARREQVARPLVAITPRTGRTTAQNLVIQARCDLTPVDVTSAQLWINGVNHSTLLPTATSANYVSWSIPMTSITSLFPNTSQPINVTFLVRAMGPAPVDPDTGAPFILGVGRNDVVL